MAEATGIPGGHAVDSSDHHQKVPPELAALDAAVMATVEMDEWSGSPGDVGCRAAVLSAALDAARPVLAAAERERIAARMDALAANYPEDVFPPGSEIRDGIAGTAMRHAYRNAAREIREQG
jgi:hypothetical protein